MVLRNRVARVNSYWESFLADSCLSDEDGQAAEVRPALPRGTWAPKSAGFSRLFPVLERLLSRAFLSEMKLRGKRYQLYSWEQPNGDVRGWLSPLSDNNPSLPIHPDHKVLLESFGGIVQYSNSPEDTWILSHCDVLTASEAQNDASFITHYNWAFEQAGVPIPISLGQFYVIAREANANSTLCHRSTGEVVLFAPDHAFDYVVPYPSCPDYTLYRIAGVKSFRDWVNAVAGQWLKGLDDGA
jgi:hypothetical protein